MITNKRIRELGQIAAKLYCEVLDSMGTHIYGHISAGKEETIVLSILATKIQTDLQQWIINDLKEKVD